jgi:predicted N-acetyltransferase YhbS
VTDDILLIPDDGHHDAPCEALYARAFGPGRHAKAAARLREDNVCQRDISFLAFVGETLVGACRLWPIEAPDGAKALFLGPIAVDMSMRSAGLGQRLVLACLAAADAKGQGLPVILVGDLSFFGRMGFETVPVDSIAMPGPVDPKRLLWRVGGASTLPQGRLSVPRATNPAS